MPLHLYALPRFANLDTHLDLSNSLVITCIIAYKQPQSTSKADRGIFSKILSQTHSYISNDNCVSRAGYTVRLHCAIRRLAQLTMTA